MKHQPKYHCPLCFRPHYTKDQVIACMELDQKEDRAKNRRLIPIDRYQKLPHNEKENILSETGAI
jgi:hypothetical protein